MANHFGFSFVHEKAKAGDESARQKLMPRRASMYSAGFDLASASADLIVLKKGERVLVPTGIAIALDNGFEAQIRPRSGIALKNGITVLNAPGTIDADYRGEIKVILINHGEHDFVIEFGMRIAQLVIARVEMAELVATDRLGDTERGVQGFGSSGVM